MKTCVLFNNKGGVGKTTLTFNLAHMAAREGWITVALDYDPQCNLTATMLDEDDLEKLWENGEEYGQTVSSCVDLVRRGKGDIHDPILREIDDDLWLLPGELALSRFEQPLAQAWGSIHATDNESSLHVTTSLARLAARAAEKAKADLVVIDVGPSLGALNRAVLLACDAVLVPLAPDLFSLQGLKNIGPTLRDWREDWERVLERSQGVVPPPPNHFARPVGYVVQQHLARADRPVTAYSRWARQIPSTFHSYVLGEDADQDIDAEDDPYCIGLLKHYASLVPLAQAARKPMFDLKRADGVAGGQIQAVARARKEFRSILEEIMRRLDV